MLFCVFVFTYYSNVPRIVTPEEVTCGCLLLEREKLNLSAPWFAVDVHRSRPWRLVSDANVCDTSSADTVKCKREACRKASASQNVHVFLLCDLWGS